MTNIHAVEHQQKKTIASLFHRVTITMSFIVKVSFSFWQYKKAKETKGELKILGGMRWQWKNTTIFGAFRQYGVVKAMLSYGESKAFIV